MNILVITKSEWDDRRAAGNTLSNWFEGWGNDTFYSLYPRATNPNNNCCYEYYSVTPLSIIKNYLQPSKIGLRFSQKEKTQEEKSLGKEKRLISWIQRHGLKSAYLMADFLFGLTKWQNKRYEQFIADSNPDIIFVFATGETFIWKNIEYVKRHTQAKLVTFVSDDLYTTYSEGQGLLMRRYRKNFEHIMNASDKVYGASEMMCTEYGRWFNKQMKPLYKGCDFMTIKDTVNQPLRIVYAGNLYYGRVDSLEIIARALENINQETVKCCLEIYTGSDVTSEISKKLNRGDSSRICGPRPYEEIKQVLNEADIVLHVESFEPLQKRDVRYSFSTKIIDCMQSGSVLMVLGPDGIASVEYVKQIPGAIVVTDINEIETTLMGVLNNPSGLLSKARDIYEFSIKNHGLSRVRSSLKDEFETLLKQKILCI